jgi:hypothetical protein
MADREILFRRRHGQLLDELRACMKRSLDELEIPAKPQGEKYR